MWNGTTCSDRQYGFREYENMICQMSRNDAILATDENRKLFRCQRERTGTTKANGRQGNSMKRIVMIVGLWVLAAVAVQAQGTITANPQGVNMASRQLWRMEGRSTGDDRYGGGIGGGLDVNGDGYDDFFVQFGPQDDVPAQWKLFYGGDPPDTIADWQTDGLATPTYPVVGEFFGDDRKMVGFGSIRVDTSHPGTTYWQQLRMFEVMSGRMSDTPMDVAGEWLCVNGVQVVNADGKPGDELAVMQGCIGLDLEVWLYRGGPGFTATEPTIIVKDTERIVSDFSYMSLGDIDGDGYVDMVTAAGYLAGWKLKFYWGNATSPWSWSNPDREILFGPENPRIYGSLHPWLLDIDGDGIKDMAFRGGYIYRSGSLKTPAERRQRLYRADEADVVFPGYNTLSGGYINDRGRRYEMVLTGGEDGGTAYWYSGGANGVDTTYEAWYTDGWKGGTVFDGRSTDVLDVNGDGWPDIGGCNWTYNNVGGTGNNGIAVIFAGGPEIPGPDSVAGIRTIAAGRHKDAVRLWPNPVHDELNIAWRGDLDRMPERFMVTDLVGRRVAWGEVEPWRGAAVWHVGDALAGVYLVSMYDGEGVLVAAASVVKE